MVEKNAAHAKHAVSLAIIARQIEAGNFTDSVRRARMKGSQLVLWTLANLAKHFRRSGEVEFAFRLQLTQGGKHVMGAVDVGIHRREPVGKRLGDEALSGEMITLVEFKLADDAEY